MLRLTTQLCVDASVSRLPRSASLFSFERGAEKAKLQTFFEENIK
jgi:hypothetical protein